MYWMSSSVTGPRTSRNACMAMSALPSSVSKSYDCFASSYESGNFSRSSSTWESRNLSKGPTSRCSMRSTSLNRSLAGRLSTLSSSSMLARLPHRRTVERME